MLVIPAKQFTATLAKLGYLGLKALLDIYLLNYSKRTITQVSRVKK